ncbi:FMN-linked oxidoreductase [Mycena albidolilacea]|uniref:FMN-linked oxidoreductase n=1 Tax=Mycena albidolilacea TaxID=1033008 RepID=A0AAD6ZHL6_9AGAR|nr:FMN-linked oxidoreductase [Mycena albidolilacea]
MAPRLFEPVEIGTIALQHRVREYYAQRATRPGTLLITESTLIAARTGGLANVPGIWGPAQIGAWREVAAAVHTKGSFIFMQLWALGRIAEPAQLAAVARGWTFPYVSASNVPLTGRSACPRALSVAEIEAYVAIYIQAARNTITVGFDGVEVHSANGYLPNQFLQDISNTRTDTYGGSIANRARFVLEVVDAIVAAVRPQRTAIRLSPWSTVHGMGMQDPLLPFSYLISALTTRHPTLTYLHLIEPLISGDELRTEGTSGFDRASALAAADDGSLVVFGRLFISNVSARY